MFNKLAVELKMNLFKQGIRSFLKEFIKLRFIRKIAHIKAAHFRQDRMGIEEFNKPWNSFDLFKVFNDEGFNHSMTGIAGTTDAVIFIGEI